MKPQSRTISPYPHRLGGHCGSGAFRDLLEHQALDWGTPLNEGLVFALGGALDLSYLRSDQLVPPVYLVGRGADMELDLPQRLGGHVEVRKTDEPSEGWEWVRSEINRGHPVLVWADIAELPYLRVRLQMSRHDIVIIGYDDSLQVAHVVDNDRVDVQEVPYDALARARHSQGFPGPNRHATYFIDWPEELPPLAPLAAEAFQQAAATMRSTGGQQIATLPGALGATGLDAASLFAGDIAAWPDELDPDTLDVALRSLGAFVEKAGTGGGLFRRLLADGARDIAAIVEEPGVAIVASAALACADRWSDVAALAGARDVDLSTRAHDAAAAASDLTELENALADALDAAARLLDEQGASA